MRKTLIATLLVCGVVTAAAFAAAETGPSSSQSPYVLPSVEGGITKSIITVGDTVGGYTMVGIPDGMGLAKDRAGNFSVYLNHELPPGRGGIRAHGANGAFVSLWSLDKHSL